MRCLRSNWFQRVGLFVRTGVISKAETAMPQVCRLQRPHTVSSSFLHGKWGIRLYTRSGLRAKDRFFDRGSH